MTTLLDCSLNGIALSSLNAQLCVLDIKENAPKMRTTSLAVHPGRRRILTHTRESLTVQIIFAIHQENPALRRAALQAVHGWAAHGGTLTTSDRPGKMLPVMCNTLPAAASLDWQEELTLTFISTDSPYWMDAQPASITGSGEMSLYVPGNAPSAPVDVVIHNPTSGNINYLTVHCGDSHIEFESLIFPAGSDFTLGFVDGVFRADIDGASMLPARTPESSDMLLLPCGQSSPVSVTAPAAVTATFSARGRYA